MCSNGAHRRSQTTHIVFSAHAHSGLATWGSTGYGKVTQSFTRRSVLPPPPSQSCRWHDRRVRVSVLLPRSPKTRSPRYQQRYYASTWIGTTLCPPAATTAWSAGFSSTLAQTPVSPAPHSRAPASTLRPARVRAPASLTLQARTRAPASPTPHPTRAEPTHHHHAVAGIESRRVATSSQAAVTRMPR